MRLGVHLLRHDAACRFRDADGAKRLSPTQVRLQAYLDAHLAGTISPEDLAQAIGVGVCTLSRPLRSTRGTTAHRYVVDRRVEKACRRVPLEDLPLKAIAAATGFPDQAHMTRTLHARPGEVTSANLIPKTASW